MLRSETFFAQSLAAAMIVLCAGCDNPARYRASLPPDHDAAATHTIEDLWHESGAYESLGPHPKVAFSKRAVSNIVLGTVRLDYDPHVGEPLPASHLSIRTNGANAVPSRAADGEFFRFRMAMMIYTDDGKKVMDFFEGISGGKDTVDYGDARVEVPELSATHAADAKKTPIDSGTSSRDYDLSRWKISVASFADLFPERVGNRFTLGFKEFNRHAYCLTDVPKGTAFVWFQTAFDGNRVMQFPAKIRIESKTGEVTRLDIHLGEAFEYFWML